MRSDFDGLGTHQPDDAAQEKKECLRRKIHGFKDVKMND